jgi:phage baseplate assembly protein gpV
MADPRERYDDPLELLKTAMDRLQSKIWTAMPVKIIADSDGNICDLQPTIQIKTPQQDGTTKDETISHSGMCPIQFASGGGFTITHPIKKDDEGIAIYAARHIDHWWEKGGTQPTTDLRQHDLSDAMYIPGIRNKPRQLGASNGAGRAAGTPPSTTSLQIRSDDGSWYIEIGPNNVVNIVCKNMTITATEKVHIDSPLVELTGDLTAKGEITAGMGTGDSVTMQNHLHTGVMSGGGLTGKPSPGTRSISNDNSPESEPGT